MPRLWAGAFAALMSIAVTSAWAGSPVVLGNGAQSCGTWTRHRQQGNPEWVDNGVWVVGYISGYNAFGLGSSDVTAGTDTQGVWAWIDNYCANNPLDTIQVAATALILELERKRGPTR